MLMERKRCDTRGSTRMTAESSAIELFLTTKMQSTQSFFKPELTGKECLTFNKLLGILSRNISF